MLLFLLVTLFYIWSLLLCLLFFLFRFPYFRIVEYFFASFLIAHVRFCFLWIIYSLIFFIFFSALFLNMGNPFTASLCRIWNL